jgi:hypothetical protein
MFIRQLTFCDIVISCRIVRHFFMLNVCQVHNRLSRKKTVNLLFWRVSLKENSHTITLCIRVLDALKVGYSVVLLRPRDYSDRLVLNQSGRGH